MLACQYDWQRELHNRSCWRYLRYRWSDRELVVRTEQRLFSQVHIRRIFRLGSPVSSIQVAVVIPLSSLTPNFSCLLTFSLIFLSLEKKRRWRRETLFTTEKKKKKNCLLDEIVFVYFDFSWFIFQYFFFVFLWFFCLVTQDVWNALLLFRVGLIHSLQFLQCWSLDSCSYLFSSQKQPPSLFTLSRFYNFLSSFLVLLFF